MIKFDIEFKSFFAHFFMLEKRFETLSNMTKNSPETSSNNDQRTATQPPKKRKRRKTGYIGRFSRMGVKQKSSRKPPVNTVTPSPASPSIPVTRNPVTPSPTRYQIKRVLIDTSLLSVPTPKSVRPSPLRQKNPLRPTFQPEDNVVSTDEYLNIMKINLKIFGKSHLKVRRGPNLTGRRK